MPANMQGIRQGVRVLFDMGYMKDIMGEVCQITKDTIQVRSTIDGEVKILNIKNLRRVRVVGPVEVDGVENMVNLRNLSQLTILENLKTRYNKKNIYTYIGSILVSVNPYVDLFIDGPEVMSTYRNQPMASMPPHVYGIAEGMYQNLIHDGLDQVVIISGESGAGKTEAFKRILRYLASSSEGDQITWGSAAQGVLESTPLLESFGNSTTLRNDNSSRFGKFVEVFFSGPTIIGARVTNYLLEKSRVVQQSPGERNYHIFYEILSGLDKKTKQAHKLTSVTDYAYLQYGRTSKVASRSDPEGLQVLLNCWSNLRFTGDDMALCLRIMSGILHLGNIEFKEEDEASHIKNPAVLEIIADELAIDKNKLEMVLTTKVTETQKEVVRSPVNAAQAKVNRDSVAKSLYSEYFDVLVQELNRRLAPPTSEEIDPNAPLHTISLLDIYGFENLPHNSLEQLCINYANENLQLFFNRYVFELEQTEYSIEGVSWSYIKFPDNKEIIDLLTKKPEGIIHILNDEAYLGQGKDSSFIQKSHSVHCKNAHYGVPKIASNSEFLIVHFAGTIAYSVDGLVEKNRDRVRPEAIEMLIKSGVPGISDIFFQIQEKRKLLPGFKGRSPTLLDGFHSSLSALMETMKRKRPWFVRCLKPNPDKKAMFYEDTMVMEQLRYIGILETVRIRSSGFPVRLPYEQFVHNYTSLLNIEAYKMVTRIRDMKERARMLLENLQMLIGKSGQVRIGHEYEMGKMKVFLRQELADSLEFVRRRRHVQAARTIQRAWRRRALGQLDRARNNAATLIQAVYRGYRARKHNHKLLMSLRVPAPLISLSNGVMWKEIEDEVDYDGPLSTAELASLPVPADLGAILVKAQANSMITHLTKNPEAEVSKTYMVKRLMNSDLPGCWTQFKGNLWTAPTIDQIIATSGSSTGKIHDKFQFGKRMSPMIRPLILNKPTQIEGEMAIEASKLIARLLFQNSDDLMEEFLTGSYLYQMALSNITLFREILFQLLNQSLNWQTESELNYATDSEDEDVIFSQARQSLVRQRSTRWKSTGKTGVQMKRSRNEINHKSAKDDMRRSHRRLWMHIAGILTCGRIPKSQRAAVIKHIRVHAPPRSLRFCEDRIVNTPAQTRLFAPSMLEWRVNYTGTNMALYLTYPDGTTANIHTLCFSRSDELANQAISLKAKMARLGRGWTIGLYQNGVVIETGGHGFVMDMLSAMEFPDQWPSIAVVPLENYFLISQMDTSQSGIGPPFEGTLRNSDAYKSGRKFERSVQMRYPSLDRRQNKRNGGNPGQRPKANWSTEIDGTTQNNGSWSRKMSNSLASSIHGVTENAQKRRGLSAAANEARWLQAVRKMAAKRYDPPKPFRSNQVRRRIRSFRKSIIGHSQIELPKANSSAGFDPDQDGQMGVSSADGDGFSNRPPMGLGFSSMNNMNGYPPHEMRYLAYKHAKWSLRVRKELITPLERMKPKRILDLVFCQIVGDVLENVTIRLTPEDVQMLRNTIGDILLNSSMNQLLFQPSAVKRMIIDAAKQCPYYFGRFYAIEPANATKKSGFFHWVIVGHRAIRFVWKKTNERRLELYAEIPLANVISCQASFRPKPISSASGASSNQKILVNVKGIRELGEANHVILKDNKGASFPMFTVHADDMKRLIDIFVAEYNIKKQKTTESVKLPSGRKEKSYVDYMSDTMSIASYRTTHTVAMEALIPFGREKFIDKHNIARQLSWQNTPLKYGSLIKHGDPNVTEASSRIFESILELSFERQASKTPVQLVQRILKLTKRYPTLEDEVFCQLVKQVNKNDSRNQDSLAMIWTLYAICSMFLNCSKNLRNMLLEHAKNLTFHGLKEQTLAATVISNLDKVLKHGPRYNLPCDSEIEAYLRGNMSKKHKINLPARAHIFVNVSPMSLIGEVAFMLADQLGIATAKERLEFTLFRIPSTAVDGVANCSLIPIELETYYFDACSYDETNENTSLYFRRVCWWTQPDLEKRSPEYIKVLFDQVVEQFLCGYWIKTNTGVIEECEYRELIQLAVNLSFIFSTGNKLTQEEAGDLMPRGVGIRKREWTKSLLDAVVKCPPMTSIEARKSLIGVISNWPLYGATCFHGELKAIPSNAEKTFEANYEDFNLSVSSIPVLVAICRKTIEILHPIRRVSLVGYALRDLKSVGKKLFRNVGEEYAGEVMLDFSRETVNIIFEQASTFCFVIDRCKRLQTIG